jgi:hypothetical protein
MLLPMLFIWCSDFVIKFLMEGFDYGSKKEEQQMLLEGIDKCFFWNLDCQIIVGLILVFKSSG